MRITERQITGTNYALTSCIIDFFKYRLLFDECKAGNNEHGATCMEPWMFEELAEGQRRQAIEFTNAAYEMGILDIEERHNVCHWLHWMGCSLEDR